MKLKLKENPREWQKFTTVIMVLFTAICFTLWRREMVSTTVLSVACAVWGAVLVTAWVYARPFRQFYRVGMTVSFRIGQVMSAVLLTFFFLLVITPLGWVLRLAGKDLLQLKRNRTATTYWNPSRPSSDFERQF